MTALRFILRGRPGQRLDLSPLTPDRLAGLGVAEIAALPLHTTGEKAAAGDVFRIVEGDCARIVIEGGSDRLDRIGSAMRTGEIVVEGDVGQLAGRGMAGGRLAINGNAGRHAGSAMRGGSLEIVGDAGDRLAGPLAGERTGMRGGALVVRGRAGARAGDRLRRGTIVVEGDAGDHAGCGMVAGTLVVCGSVGALPGILMRRGTIVAARTTSLSPSFVDAAPVGLVFTRLLERALAPLSERATVAVAGASRRCLGDLAALGRGELFLSP